MFDSKKKFEKLQSRFNAHKERFRTVINAWKDAGWTRAATRAQELLQELELRAQGLATRSAAAGYAHDWSFRQDVRRFKKMYKEMSESIKPLWRQWIEALLFAGGLAFVIRSVVFGLYHVPTGSAEPTILVGDRIWGNKMAYHVGPFKIGSVKRGDMVIVDNPEFPLDHSSKLQYYWQRYVGIPIFGLKGGPDNWVKRVIGLPGDTIEGREEEGMAVIYLNGKKFDEPYINPYPLIALSCNIGFIDKKSVQFPLPSWLLKQRAPVEFFTFDPSKPTTEQPFYNFEFDEIYKHPETGKALFREPYYAEDQDFFGPYTIPVGNYWVMGDSRKNSKDSRTWLFLNEELIHGRASVVLFSLDSKEPFWLLDLIKQPIEFWTKTIRWNRTCKVLK